MQRPLYGAHIFLWIERWTNAELYLYDNARKLGLDCLEIAVGEDVQFDAKAVKQAADSMGLKTILSPGGHWPVEADISLADTHARQLAIDWHRQWIDQAHECGAVAYTGALYGHPGHVNRTTPDPDEFQRVRDGLARLAEYGHQADIDVVIEPMSHFRTHFINTPRQAVTLVNAVGHPRLKILFDTYHLVTEIRDFRQGIMDCGKLLWGLHPCENDRGAPGQGLVPWQEVYRGLKQLDFKGYAIFESYNSAIGQFAFSRGMFHNVCPDGNTFVRNGMAHLEAVRES